MPLINTRGAAILSGRPIVAVGALGAPFLIGGGTEVGITAGTTPRSTTTATCPAGSVIMAAVLNAGDNSASLTGFSDGTNTYTTPTPVTPYGGGTGAQTFALYATGPLGAPLASGTSVGPNLSASTRIYQVLICFPGVTTLDPEAAALNTGSNTSTATASVPANATQPQYVGFFVLGSSQASGGNLTAPYTDVGLATAIASDFGIRAWVTQLTTTSGSPTSLIGTFTAGGGGVSWAAGERTVQ